MREPAGCPDASGGPRRRSRGLRTCCRFPGNRRAGRALHRCRGSGFGLVTTGQDLGVDDTWQPRRRFPVGLVTPVPVDPAGRSGPTRGRAAGPRWRRTGPGLFVPAEVPWSAEQRIVEVAAGLPEGALVTGWTALRLSVGGFIDGLDAAMRPLRVPVLIEHRRRLRSDPDRVVLRDRALPAGTVRHGVACVLPQRAVLDAMRLASDGRAAVVVMDMAAEAAGGRAGAVRPGTRPRGEPVAGGVPAAVDLDPGRRPPRPARPGDRPGG